MAIADELVAVLKVDNSQLLDGLRKAKSELQGTEKKIRDVSGGETRLVEAHEKVKKAMAGTQKDAGAASDSFKKLSASLSGVRSSFLSLRTVFTGFLVGAGISRLAESVTKVSNLSQITGQSVGSIRALGNVFEQLGYSAGEANGTIQSISDSLAKARYGGGLSGALIPMSAYGIRMTDKNGNPREVAHMMIELGEAVQKSSKNVAEARMKLKSMGFDNASIAFMTAENPRELLAQQKASAAAYEKQAEAAQKLHGFIKQLEQAFTSLGVQVLPVVTPIVKDITGGIQKLVSVANEHPEGIQTAIKAIGMAALAAKGPVGMLVASLLALKELYEKAQEWLESGNETQKAAVSGEHAGETVDASVYGIESKGEKKGDWSTGAYKAADSAIQSGVDTFKNLWGADDADSGTPQKGGADQTSAAADSAASSITASGGVSGTLNTGTASTDGTKATGAAASSILKSDAALAVGTTAAAGTATTTGASNTGTATTTGASNTGTATTTGASNTGTAAATGTRTQGAHRNRNASGIDGLFAWLFGEKKQPVKKPLQPYVKRKPANETSGGFAAVSSSGGYSVEESKRNFNAKSRAAQSIRFFMSKGYTEDEAKAITANLQAESAFKEWQYGDNRKAYGLAQWHPDRQAEFKEHFGKDIRKASFEEQLAFVDWELKHKEKGALKKMREAKTLSGKTAAITRYYERPADKDGQSAYRARIAMGYGHVGDQSNMLALARQQQAGVVNNTQNQTITNNIDITVSSAKEASEIAGQYTSGKKNNQRMASGVAV